MPRVLIVDDDPDVRELIELTLEGQGHDVDRVESGYADAGPYEDFLRTVPVPVVGKPFDINVLREIVSRLLSGT